MDRDFIVVRSRGLVVFSIDFEDVTGWKFFPEGRTKIIIYTSSGREIILGGPQSLIVSKEFERRVLNKVVDDEDEFDDSELVYDEDAEDYS